MNPAFVRPHRLHVAQTGLAFAVASLLAVAPSDAQSLRLTRSTVVSDVDEGMGTIHTGELQLLLPLRGSRVSARSSLSYGRTTIDRTATGNGFLWQDRSLSMFSLGLGADLVQTSRAELQISTDLLLARSRFTDVHLLSRDTRGLSGARISVNGTWWVTARSPIGLHAAGSMGMLKPMDKSACIGCNGVLSDKSFRASRLAAGVAIRRPTR